MLVPLRCVTGKEQIMVNCHSTKQTLHPSEAEGYDFYDTVFLVLYLWLLSLGGLGVTACISTAINMSWLALLAPLWVPWPWLLSAAGILCCYYERCKGVV